jgi:copper(I)-binding protein
VNRQSWWIWVGRGAHPRRRVHPALVAAVVAAAVGVAGLWYGGSAGAGAGAGAGAAPAAGEPSGGPAGAAGHESGHESGDESGGGSGAGSDTGAVGGGATAGDIIVRGGYLREPASPTVAAAYLSITNTGEQPDTLLSVYCGAARSTTLHDVPGAAPATSKASGGGSGGHVPSGPVTIAPGATLTLSPGHGHLMLTELAGPLRPGDNVSLLLSFQRSGQVLVELPVLAIGALAPDGSRR